MKKFLNRVITKFIKMFTEYQSKTETVDDVVVRLNGKYCVASSMYRELFEDVSVDDKDPVHLTRVRNVLENCRLSALEILCSHILSLHNASYVNGILSDVTRMQDEVESIMMKRSVFIPNVDELSNKRDVRYTISKYNSSKGCIIE